MSDLLTIGSSGISAYQRALATVSNNIANVNTEGYTRQDVSLASNQPRLMGGSYMGTGARFDAVRRQYDAFVESNLRNSQSDLKSQEPLLSYVNRLIDVMGDQSIGLTSAMNVFFESARDLASNPASTVQRSIFLRDAEGLAARFQQLSKQFELLDNETRQSVETDVGQANSLTNQLALLNKQLSKHSHVDQQPSELLDQRDLLLRKLSEIISIKTKFAENGSVLVSIGDTIDQGILVQNDKVRALSVQTSSTDATRLEFVIDAYGTPETLRGIPSGHIGGLVNFRDQVLAPAMGSLDDLASVVVKEVNAIHRDGIDAEGKLGGDLFGFIAGRDGQAGGMTMVVQDVNRVAAAGLFRIIDDPLNSGTAQARISYSPAEYAGPTSLAGDLNLAQAPRIASLATQLGQQGFTPLGLVPVGMSDLTLTLQNPSGTQTLQVLTRDGRHLIGSPLSGDQQAWLVKTANGMEPGATYSSAGINARDSASYMDMDIFMGAKAAVGEEQQFDTDGKLLSPLKVPALLTGKVFAGTGSIAQDTFTLNGHPMPALGGSLSLASVVSWVNAESGTTGIFARDVNGKLELFRPAGNVSDDIRLGLGSAGTPTDLQRLGFDTSVYIEGQAPDDLLVFVTGNPGSAVTVSAQYQSAAGDMKQALRATPLSVEFISDRLYRITDTRSGTVMAERQLVSSASSPTPSLSFRGLKLEFSTWPKTGDKFSIDGNTDGIGNNEAMLRLVDLEGKRIMPGGLTMTEAYIERVSQVGNVARQSAIAQQALTVVYRQAVEARDSISGVSLDEEASALVRFQQAYQANAKVMQTSMTLFESILQVR